MPKLTIVLFVLATLCLHREAKIFSKCGLVKELRRQGFPTLQLSNWLCLIEAESGRNTAAVSPVHSDGSRDWGLFQINDKLWCNTYNGNFCNVTCTDLRTDNITKASRCAQMIYERHKYSVWYGWVNKCMEKPLPDISKCK